MVNVLLFCTTRRILPTQSVVPGWRGLLWLSGFTESNQSQDTDKSIVCKGMGLEGCLDEDEEAISPRPQLDDPHWAQVRIKIDNHIDNTLESGENRDSASDVARGIVPSSQLATASPRSG